MANEENVKKGGISVDTTHLFPIIKKWLYSDKEIFLREIVSNACDAITKYKRLCSLGEAVSDGSEGKITITVDKELKTLTFSDNGIGMSMEEVDKYINQIALSGAVDFMEKYEQSEEDNASGIIGHFGLGFYSSFMIADRVEIISQSFDLSQKPVIWKGTEAGEFEMENYSEEKARGTDIILHVNDDETEFLEVANVRRVTEKFCSFMPFDIFITEVKEEKTEEQEKNEAEPINDKTPLWQKNAKDCTAEEYNEFYKKVFNDYKDPLFSIHINADYPLNFKGILYFPKLSHEYDNMEGQVKLYYNQVFVADNIKEVIPEFLLMLKGVLDCPELPLNVSRSYLQTNGYVSKITAHIVKKVADKLNSLFNTERENYEKLWTDIKPFVEYGCLKDEKFYNRVKDSIVFKTTEGKYVTLSEYAKGEKYDKTVYYTDDAVQQSRYISMFKNEGLQVVVLDRLIDRNFISFFEQKLSQTDEYKDVKFVRVDSGIAQSLRADEGEAVSEEKKQKLTRLFKAALGIEDKTADENKESSAAQDESFKLNCEFLKDSEIPAMLNLSEQSRRFADMMRMYNMNGDVPMMPMDETLVLNMSNPLIKKIADKCEDDSVEDELTKALAKQIYMLALVAQRQLTAEELSSFIKDSVSLYEKL